MFQKENEEAVRALRKELAGSPSIELRFVDAVVRSNEVQAEEVISRVSSLRPENEIYARVKEMLNGNGV